MPGQRELNQNAVNFIVCVQIFDQSLKLVLLGVFGQGIFVRVYSYIFTCLFLVVYIYPAGRVVADDYNRKAYFLTFFF